MTVQVLVAAMHQTDHSLLEKMNIQTDVIVGNQCDYDSVERFEYRGRRALYLNFAERGVGLNRNNALMRASGDICLFADDDCVYVNGYEQIILAAYGRHPDADVIVFNMRVSRSGEVPKSNIPSILTQAYATILHNSSTSLDKYGQSQNKFFEFLAAGRPILMTYSVGHSIVKEKNCGIELDEQTPEMIATAIERLACLSHDDYDLLCRSAQNCAEKYDFKKLTQTLIQTINLV